VACSQLPRHRLADGQTPLPQSHGQRRQEWRFLAGNPASGVTLLEAQRQKMKALSPEEARRFREACDAHSLPAMKQAAMGKMEAILFGVA